MKAKRFFCGCMLLSLLLSLISCAGKTGDGEVVSNAVSLISGTTGKGRFVPVTYPADTIKTLESYGMTENDFIKRARNNATYVGNQGYESPSVYVSPAYTLTVNRVQVPVYCALTYVGGEYGDGAIHSYAMIDMADDDFLLEVTLTSLKNTMTNAVVLPKSLGVEPAVKDQKTISATLTSRGTYTFLTNEYDDAVSQFTAFTLFVRKYADEEKEIAAYQKQYGKDRVLVYDAGVHKISHIDLNQDNMVLYLRRGAYLIPEHNSGYSEKNMQLTEADAPSNNGLGLKRWPAINVYMRKNIKILGRGTLDMGRQDQSERLTMAVSLSSNVEIDGITLVNPCGWNITTYRSENIKIQNVAVFGYRTTSDAVAICNSKNATVSDCFARSGDDLFEVKALGSGDESAVTKNVKFENCYAWAGKARCFGLTHETLREVSDVTFKKCSVLFCDSTWDNRNMGTLVVVIGEGYGNVSGITFEDIDIYQCLGRPFLVAVNKKGTPRNTISNVVFRNIAYTGPMSGLIHTQNDALNNIQVSFENITANGTKLTEANKAKFLTATGPSITCTVQ